MGKSTRKLHGRNTPATSGNKDKQGVMVILDEASAIPTRVWDECAKRFKYKKQEAPKQIRVIVHYDVKHSATAICGKDGKYYSSDFLGEVSCEECLRAIREAMKGLS